MAEQNHKRKRSLQDSTIDLSKMRIALNGLEAFKEELDGIEETEEELLIISEHILALEDILKGAKKQRVTFSTVRSEDLKKAGVQRKRLIFDHAKITELMNLNGLTTNAQAEIADLHSRIMEIYACVNMDYESGSRMILDAILLTLAAIFSTQNSGVAILPGMRIAPWDEIHISHPVSGYQSWLSGNVDYAVVEYEDVQDHKDRLLDPDASREGAFEITKGRLFLVKAKRQKTFVSYIPEAISQAIALLKSANLPEVRFCLSDGQRWMFFLLKLENGTPTYYESVARHFSKDILEHSDLPLRPILQIVCEWLRPTATGLFTLE